MKVNLGCGKLPLTGYLNVDQYAAEANVVGDVRELTFKGVDEVRASHLLEHLPVRDVLPLLKRIKTWMNPGAEIIVEVPDMKALMASPRKSWLSDVYGTQETEGEFHKSGFNEELLIQVLELAGFSDIEVRAFISDHPYRAGYPCLEAHANA